jgi:hypothetical protein
MPPLSPSASPESRIYSVPKAYRPIALLNTLSKLLEALIASRMSYLAEAHGLLPDNHFGGRRGQGTETALHAALEAIIQVGRMVRWYPRCYLTSLGPPITSPMTDFCITSAHAGSHRPTSPGLAASSGAGPPHWCCQSILCPPEGWKPASRRAPPSRRFSIYSTMRA